jgi:hypothetical protein
MLILLLFLAAIIILAVLVLTIISLFVIFVSGGDTLHYLDGVDLDPDN